MIQTRNQPNASCHHLVTDRQIYAICEPILPLECANFDCRSVTSICVTVKRHRRCRRGKTFFPTLPEPSQNDQTQLSDTVR